MKTAMNMNNGRAIFFQIQYRNTQANFLKNKIYPAINKK